MLTPKAFSIPQLVDRNERMKMLGQEWDESATLSMCLRNQLTANTNDPQSSATALPICL